MDRLKYDVAIIGGGPGGSATALGLRTYAPSLSVVLIEASSYATPRIGETLPPPAQTILEHLGVWEPFQAQGHLEVHGTRAVWGAGIPIENEYFYMPANKGWHLNRSAFDAMLAEQAERRGATLLLNTRLREAERINGSWHLTLTSVDTVAARFTVDASGGSAVLARRLGARLVDNDHLVGIARFFEGVRGDPRILIEAFEQGWWYTAGLPNGRRITACMTDADLARRLGLSKPKQWGRILAAMETVGAMFRGKRACTPIVVRSSESRRLEPAAGDDWLAVGDSASRFDPLSSQGIVKALRSGIFASYAIGDLLTRDDDSGLRRYRRFISDEFRSYAETRTKYYQQEQRWPTREFWLRRHASESHS
jgi:flavin-dependent dehydrogenase